MAASKHHIELTKRALLWLDNKVTGRGMRGTVELTLGEGYIADAGAIAGLQMKFEEAMVGRDRGWHDLSDDYSFIFETKVSKADYKNTFVNCNHAGDRLTPRGNFHYIVSPPGLCEPPSFWGLLEESGRGLRVKKEATFCPQSLEHLYEFAYRVLRYSKSGKFSGWDLENELRKMTPQLSLPTI